MPIIFERARLNVWNITAAFVGMAVTAFGWGVTYNSMNAATSALASQLQRVSSDIANVQTNFGGDIKDIRTQLPGYAQIQYQLQQQVQQGVERDAETKATIVENSKRVDRIVDSTTEKLDKILDQMNKLSIRLEVVAATRDREGVLAPLMNRNMGK